jgi:FkbM family methyltransferase
MTETASPLPILSPEQNRVKPWFAIGGDKSLRINYNLGPDSVVFDVGGYRGDWAREIYRKYKCHIEVFEPVKEFIKILRREFAGNNKVNIHPFGLAGKTEEVEISLDEASSSTFKSGKSKERIKLVDASKFIGESYNHIDLMKINIEGGEYSLLDDLIKSGLIKNIENIQVQFHDFVPNAFKKRMRLHEKLSGTHELTYNYPWVWENWRLKK